MITNKATGEVISPKEKVCRSIFSQMLGLMFHRRQNLVMIFPGEKKIRLHMFFVFFPIDVLVVDSKMKIIEIKKDFRPFTFWNSKEKGKYVVELGEKSDAEYSVGDVLEIE